VDWRYLLNSFDGRISRQPFWIAMVLVVGAEAAAHVVAQHLEGERLSAIVDLAFTYPEFAIAAKRGHDRNVPTWVPGLFFALGVLINLLIVMGVQVMDEQNAWLFYGLALPVSLFGVAMLVDFGFRKGTPGPNRYGPDPLGPKPVQ
jgi:uncharacterized membrane protein YhaH (DUF805 family)